LEYSAQQNNTSKLVLHQTWQTLVVTYQGKALLLWCHAITVILTDALQPSLKLPGQGDAEIEKETKPAGLMPLLTHPPTPSATPKAVLLC